MRGSASWIVVAVALVAGVAAKPVDAPVDVPALLARIGQRVEQYYARAQSIICVETVRLQPLSFDLSFDGGHVRQLVYELRISWEPPADDQTPPEAKVMRELLKVDGRAPRPGDEPGCLDPKPVSTEPLAMLLPARQREYAFTWAGTGRTDRRDSLMLEYKATTPGEPSVTFKGECISVELPGRNRGRVWADAATGDVLRLDEQLVGMFEFRLPKEHVLPNGPTTMVIERADSSIKYQPVAFHDPEETVMLPASIQTLTVVRNSGSPRTRMTQTFSNYKRFLTGGRIVKDPGAR
ncbi:MAG TPA: hypothetical protein VG222_04665 [Vicinamibacterales bacterium]|jgi:hypothetical protein|nr:hypothetical protein [Vicinamibacterales bacterium]